MARPPPAPPRTCDRKAAYAPNRVPPARSRPRACVLIERVVVPDHAVQHGRVGDLAELLASGRQALIQGRAGHAPFVAGDLVAAPGEHEFVELGLCGRGVVLPALGLRLSVWARAASASSRE